MKCNIKHKNYDSYKHNTDAIIIDVDELPPPLLSVKDCEGFDLQIGGFPYRLLSATTAGRYLIRNVHDNTKIGEHHVTKH